MNFFFMEMNTRLQVEHPVTEAITGQDLVEWQLRVAAGEPLPLTQDELKIHGHAIEARICAENPDNNFLPATGTLAGVPPAGLRRIPAALRRRRDAARGGQDVRVDSGVREGDAISPFYDSMVAKLIVHGDTREQALARLDAALAATHIVGLATNVQFLRHVVGSRSFSQADLDTALIPREAAVLFKQEKVGLPLAVAAAVAQTLLAERAGEGADPFSRRDSWRSHGAANRRFDFEFKGEGLIAQLVSGHDGVLVLTVGEVSGPLQFLALEGGRIELRFAGQRQTVQTWQRGETVHVFCDAGRDADRGDRRPGPCRRSGRGGRAPDRADAGQGGVVLGQGRRQGPHGPAAGGDGCDEDGAHHCRAGRRHRGRTALRAGRPGGRRGGTAEAAPSR